MIWHNILKILIDISLKLAKMNETETKTDN
jgi:hypothetical protein